MPILDQSGIPTVQIEETKDFSTQWTYKGLSVPLTEVHIQFATDFANIMLMGFVEFCKQQSKKSAVKEDKWDAEIDGKNQVSQTQSVTEK
jgi:hypothetical protein